jgi:hypothetical protein
MHVVINYTEMGIYLGNCLGLGFWSKLDPVGQDAAVTFPSEVEARRHVASWNENNDPASYEYRLVATNKDRDYATISDLKDAGLTDLLGDLEADFLRFAEPVAAA